MKASELAAELMKHPDATVYIEYIPYGDDVDIIAEHNPTTNRTILEFETNSD